MGSLVETVSAWVWVGAGLVAIIAGIYGGVKWARKQLRDAVVDDVKPMIDGLHACLDTHAQTMEEHIRTDQESFANINARMDRDTDAASEDRAELMLMLRNLQQAQHPPTGTA